MQINSNKLLLLIISFLAINIANAANLSAVDSKNCDSLKNTTKPFILVLTPGENLIESVVDCADAANLSSASLNGLGTLMQAELAYYNIAEQRYQYKKFSGLYELTSLNGNIGFSEGKRFAHIHVALGNNKYQLIGGHLAEAEVGPTVEITITPLRTPFIRNYNKETEARLIVTKK